MSGPQTANLSMGQPGTTIIINNQQVLGTNPTHIHCSQCGAQVLSKTTPKAGLLTWLIAGALFLVGCWPCCCIPCCLEDCQDFEHFCPQCNNYLGTYKRIK